MTVRMVVTFCEEDESRYRIGLMTRAADFSFVAFCDQPLDMGREVDVQLPDGWG